jgi:type IX secretion system PorP/SprF family membrane protein
MRKLFVLLALGLGLKAGAQVDPHFTQYYVYPSWLNPALTGVFDGDYRVSGIYRTQWGNISSPFSTPGISLDFNTNRNANFGVSALKQSAGDGGYTYTTAYGNFAYTGVRFDGGMKRLVFGLQAGLIQRRFNPQKLTFGDQWNPVTGFNPTNPTSEVITRPTASSFDAGAGVFYYDAKPGKKTNLFAGFSVAHLTRPTDDFAGTAGAKLPMRFTGHAGLRIAVSDLLSVTPNALYLRQGSASETMIGAYAQYRSNPNLEFLFGANYRFKDAVSPYVGFYYKNLVLGVTYDANVSQLGKIARASNSFEISLTFIGRKSAKTPEAEFICPRL